MNSKEAIIRRHETEGKPLLLGEAPSKRGDEYFMYPLSGPPSRVLCQLSGTEPLTDGTAYGRWYWALNCRFRVGNLIRRYADAEPWRVPYARERALEVLPHLPRVTVLLGVRVADAFFPGARPSFYEPTVLTASQTVVVIPHPSGLNRLYNDQLERFQATHALSWALREAAR